MRRAKTLLTQTGLTPAVTHEVFNQVPFLEGFNSYRANAALSGAYHSFRCEGGIDNTPRFVDYGAKCGSKEWLETAVEANLREPTYMPFDKQGRRIDSAKLCDAYHRLMDLAVSHHVPSLAYLPGQSQVDRIALSYLHYQLEQGTSCPLTMTYAAVPPLRANSPNGEFAAWVEKLTSGHYDSRDVAASLKRGVTCGMSMTEKQGGSDVRANTTTATRIEHDPSWDVAPKAEAFSLVGHKWFTSAPMCDAFLTLAQTKEGLGCFLVPRWLSPQQRNVGLRFQRLKAKLGDKSNASSEVEYHGAVGFLVGKLGRGVPTIIEMVNHTRLDCLVGSSALMQIALVNAVHHACHREAFGGRLVDKPLMANVLTDLALEVEGSTALALRVASSFDDPRQESYKRIATAIGKYYVCKRAPAHVYECLECLGGNGYTEDFPLARFFRQAPLNAVWEGSGNVIVADVFRAMAKDQTAMTAIGAEVAATSDAVISKSFATVTANAKALMASGQAEMEGRRMVEHLALILQACAVVRARAPAEVRSAFIASRLGDGTALPGRPVQFGTLQASLVAPSIFLRHRPTLE